MSGLGLTGKKLLFSTLPEDLKAKALEQALIENDKPLVKYVMGTNLCNQRKLEALLKYGTKEYNGELERLKGLSAKGLGQLNKAKGTKGSVALLGKWPFKY